MDYREFTSMQIDALKEVFNIGTGNSVTALSSMLNKKIDMNVPNLRIVSLQEILSSEADSEVLGVLVKAIGEAPGNILYTFKKEVASSISTMLLGQEEVFTELGMSIIGEIGNIVASSYINAITVVTGLSIVSSVPAVAYDMLSSILTTTVIEAGQYDDYILEIETLFKGDGDDIMGNFYYIPEPGSLEKILTKLGMN